MVTVGSIFRGGQVLSKNVKKSQENGINISGSTTGGRKVANRFTPKFLQIVKGCAMRFLAPSGTVCICISVVGKVPTKCPIYWPDANSLNVVGTYMYNKKRKTQCLKITVKVSFNNASEASYVYILSGQKFIKNEKNGQFWRDFENL